MPSDRAPVLTARSGRVKDARALLQAKQRRERGQLLAEGPQAVHEALAEGVVAHVFVDPELVDRRQREVIAARERGIAVHLVEAAALASLTTAQTPQGIVAVCHWEPVPLGDLLAELDHHPGLDHHPELDQHPGLDHRTAAQVALAHEMSDPGNAGALIRVADAAGAGAVLLSAGSVDPSNAKCVRASAGSLFHLPVSTAGETLAVIARLQAEGWRTLAADVTDESVELFAAEADGLLSGAVAWVFGNEAHGLPDAVLAAVDAVVRIPILGRAESLNLATAAAVCLYAHARVARS